MKKNSFFFLLWLLFFLFLLALCLSVAASDFLSSKKERPPYLSDTLQINIFELDMETYRSTATFSPPLTHRQYYIDWLQNVDQTKSLDEETLKFYALYFPQWYPAKENYWLDDWRYMNDTLLTENHYKTPIMRPKHQIYYDPRHYQTRVTQRNLALQYGIDGFIYYDYWYDQAILPDVVELMLTDGEPAIDFAFLWVNEDFKDSSRGIEYGNPLRHALHLARFMQHPRYIRIKGRPVYYVYLSTDVPPSYLKELSEHLMGMGFPAPYFIQCLQEYKRNNFPLDYMDGFAEFPPNFHQPDDIRTYPVPSFQLGLQMNYDNTPRFTRGLVLPGRPIPLNPTKDRIVSKFQRDKRYIKQLCGKKIASWFAQNQGPKIVMIFAWNEWSEQASLEPSDVMDYQLLEALAECKEIWK